MFFDSFDLRLLWALLFLDVVTTAIAMRLPGLGEGNPMMRKLMTWWGNVPALVITRAAIAIYVNVNAAMFDPHMLWMLAAVYLVVVLNNVRLIVQARRHAH